MDFFNIVKRMLSKVSKAEPRLSIPPNPSLGDVSSGIAFSIAQSTHKQPNIIAKEIASKLSKSRYISEIRVVGPYINFFFNKDIVAKKVISEALSKSKQKNNGKTICLDIFGPNALKGIHVGHIRNAALGACLARVLRAGGYKVKTISFGCDIGLPIAKVLWGFMNLGLKPDGDKGEWLGTIYSIANEMFNNDLKVKSQVYDINKRLYNNDPDLIPIYKRLINWSFDYVKRVEKELRVKINRYTWESDSIPYAMKIISLLKKKGLAFTSNGALIVDLTNHGLGVYVLLTKQGVPTYEAKDLGLQLLKEKAFKADKYIIFTAAEQVMHFKQIIKTMELLGRRKGTIIHKPYEIVRIEGEKISSRKGNVILYSQLMDRLVSASLDEVSKHGTNLSIDDKLIIAKEIALSSLLYGMIKQDMNKVIDFKFKDWVKFDGDTGAYIQYSFVRANNILKNHKVSMVNPVITKDEEFNLIKKINEYDSIIKLSITKLNPSIIARYAFELANSFNKFYEHCPVVKDEINYSRLLIVKAFINRMSSVMKLMGFKPLKRM